MDPHSAIGLESRYWDSNLQPHALRLARRTALTAGTTGHEYVACQARKAGIGFTKEGNCFTHISDAAGLAKIADTLSAPRTVGRLSQACERWMYTACLCFALDLEEPKRSRFHYQYSNYQVEYSRNLILEVGGNMD